MKVEKLIEELQKLPKGIEVCVYDYEFHAREADGEPSGIGIYKDFEVGTITKKDGAKKDFAVIGFKSTVFEYYEDRFNI